MRRGSLAVSILSGLTGIAVLAAAVSMDQVVSLGGLLGVVLLVNAIVRFAMARRPAD
jgi:hypothetical protein